MFLARRVGRHRLSSVILRQTCQAQKWNNSEAVIFANHPASRLMPMTAAELGELEDAHSDLPQHLSPTAVLGPWSTGTVGEIPGMPSMHCVAPDEVYDDLTTAVTALLEPFCWSAMTSPAPAKLYRTSRRFPWKSGQALASDAEHLCPERRRRPTFVLASS